MPKILLIAKREYLKIVRKKVFWLATLALPTFIIAVSIISNLSAEQSVKQIQKQASASKLILISDPSGQINPSYIAGPLQLTGYLERARQQVIDGSADALFVYPSDVLATHKIDVYAKSKGLLNDTGYSTLATDLLKTSILSSIGDAQKIAAYSANFNINLQTYKNGALVDNSLERFLVPGALVIIYFFMIMFASSYLLLSVAEEKENRMIETILSVVKPRELIFGKIIGQIGVVLTQVVTLIIFAVVGFSALSLKLPIPINFAAVKIDPVQLIFGVWCMACGFLIMANTMVGLGSIMPSYRDAQSFSSIFIIATIFPIYFITILLADPTGAIARAVSFFPYTAAMVLLFRNALDALPWWEMGLSIIALAVYTAASFYLAYKLFEIGALEYKAKLPFGQIVKRVMGK